MFKSCTGDQCPISLVVMTSPFHGGNGSSTLPWGTSGYSSIGRTAGFHPAHGGSTPSTRSSVSGSSNGRIRGFDPRHAGSSPAPDFP